MRKKNKKRINPRYFLNESALQEEPAAQKDKVTRALAHLAAGVRCENPEMADWGHHFSPLRWASGEGADQKRIIGFLKELEETARSKKWGFARQALMHLQNYYKKAGLLDWDAYEKKAQDLCPKGPSYPGTGPTVHESNVDRRTNKKSKGAH